MGLRGTPYSYWVMLDDGMQHSEDERDIALANRHPARLAVHSTTDRDTMLTAGFKRRE